MQKKIQKYIYRNKSIIYLFIYLFILLNILIVELIDAVQFLIGV